MTNFDRITQSPAALADFLSVLPVLEAPWNSLFQSVYCAGCPAENCDACPHSTERDNPGWWLNQEADGPEVARLGTMIVLDPAEMETPLTPEEQAAAENLRHMSRYVISYTDELTEAEIDAMSASEKAKAALRFLSRHNSEKRVVRVTPIMEPWILLHGAADVQSFISRVRDMSRKAFESEGTADENHDGS